MPSSLPAPRTRKLPVAALVLGVVVLFLAKAVLVPIALAVLLSFLLAPPVRRLERFHLPRLPAVMLVAATFFTCFAIIGWMTAHEIVDLAGKLPGYQGNIQSKLDALRGKGGSLRSAADVLSKITQRADETADAAAKGGPEAPSARANSHPAGGPEQPPLAVRVVEPPSSPPQLLRNLFGPLLAPIGMAGIVIVFTVFILLAREDLRDRVLHLAGPEHLPLTTQAVDEAGNRVSRYLQAEVAVNFTLGCAVATGLYFIGVPNAALWGLLSALFRFVPYVGFWASSLGPLLLSLAAFHGWWPMGITAALFITLEVITSNALEPWIYGASTGLSPVAVVVAATFWTWLWGGEGLLLSTPLTVCIVVLGRYMPQLEFLHTLLGDEPVLPMDTRLYQRLLAGDQEEVSELVETCLASQTSTELYDQVVIPALNQAQLDAQQGALAEDRQQFILQTIRTLIEDVSERRAAPAVAETSGAADASTATAASQETAAAAPATMVPAAATGPLPLRVLILPVKTDADELAGLALGHLLTAASIGSEVLAHGTLVNELTATVSARQATIVCLSAVRPFPVMQARHLAKRLRAAVPGLKILIGVWDAKKPSVTARRSLDSAQADWIAGTLAEAVEQLRHAVHCLPEL